LLLLFGVPLFVVVRTVDLFVVLGYSSAHVTFDSCWLPFVVTFLICLLLPSFVVWFVCFVQRSIHCSLITLRSTFDSRYVAFDCCSPSLRSLFVCSLCSHLFFPVVVALLPYGAFAFHVPLLLRLRTFFVRSLLFLRLVDYRCVSAGRCCFAICCLLRSTFVVYSPFVLFVAGRCLLLRYRCYVVYSVRFV
jgi:hypothetical protein